MPWGNNGISIRWGPFFCDIWSHVCMFLCVRARVCARTGLCGCACVYLCASVRTRACVRAQVCSRTCLRAHVCVRVPVCVHTHAQNNCFTPWVSSVLLVRVYPCSPSNTFWFCLFLSKARSPQPHALSRLSGTRAKVPSPAGSEGMAEDPGTC